MKRNSLLICLFAVLFLSSCGGRSKTASALANGDTIPLRYAENLTLMSYPGYTLATLRNPWDTLHTLHTYILVPKDRELPAHLPGRYCGTYPTLQISHLLFRPLRTDG